MEDTATPIFQTDASDYGIGGYLYLVTIGKVRFFSKTLTGAQLNWSTREKECYGIYFGVKTFEDLLDNRYFILKTDISKCHTDREGSAMETLSAG